MIADQMTRASRRLRGAVTTGSDAVSYRMAGISGDLRKVTDQFLVVDIKSASAVGRAASKAPILFGVSPVNGMPHAFHPDQVRSLPILGRDNKIVGVNFPLKLRDSKQPLTFTGYALDTIGNFYRQSVRAGGRSRKPQWMHRGNVPTPWEGDRSKKLVYARAHANQDAYYVQVAKKIPFTRWSRWAPVRIDGENYGRLLAADRHFKEAVQGAPTAELIQMSCDAARGRAAPESASSLHSYGIGLDVHATEKTHFYHFDDHDEGPGAIRQEGSSVTGHGTEVALDRAGNPVSSPWKVFKALTLRPDGT